MRRFFDALAFWRRWDERERSIAAWLTGFAVAALGLFVLIASVSYLFHWQQDMSLLSDPSMMNGDVAVGNAAGKMGYKTGYLLVCELFGLGSFALPLILFAISAKLMSGKWRYSLIKTTLIAASGALVAAILLAFVGNLFGENLQYAFGGGLGGECGSRIVAWGGNLFGPVITGLLVILLVGLWLFLSSRRFIDWAYELLHRDGDRQEEEETVDDFEDTDDAGAEEKEGEEEEEEEEDNDAGEEAPEEKEETEAADAEPAKPGEEGLEVITDENNTLDVDHYEELPPIDNRLDPPEGLPSFKFPSIDLLKSYASDRRQVSMDELQRNNNKIRVTLRNYRIEVTDVKAQVGPTVTLYKLTLAPGVRIQEVKRLQDDIALALNARGVRVVTLQDSVGIEVANDYSSIVPLKSLLNSEAFRESKYELPVAIGYTITQHVKVFDLAEAPHLLIAGATKQGKSVGLNVIIGSLLYSKHPSELKFVFIDPKMVEFSAYGKLLKHYLAVLPTAGDEEEERNKAIVKNAKDADKVLKSLCVEMDQRYELLSKAGCNKVTLYNERFKARKLNPKNGHRYLPYLVTVVDEYADLTMTLGASPEVRASSKSITNSIIRLAQKGRAAGIHVILATQRPSVDVISGIIKSNFPMRIAFRVASRTDSMTILDSTGAETLIGKGDMLLSGGIENERIQCGFVSGDEIDDLTSFIGKQQGYNKSYNTPYYLPEVQEEGSGSGSGGELGELDERFEEAAKMVVTTKRGSTSDLQRRLGMGYAKAGRVMDQLEKAGIVGPQEGSKPRAVLVDTLEELQTILDTL